MIEPFTSAIGNNATTLAMVMLAYLAGAMTPVYFAQERMRGFGRALASRLPYEPPPGVEEGEAMEAATDEAADE
ncbi:hypothetical protein [Halorubrum lipolyticum]|uniref:Uncharacterized protein n=1 Tax=Halorubrum lipolyticum DSM 21995 TaxID=1227482 RepID=M0NGQ9_9EURY|nr:hypothetical protein [Halorubrum lipolyticum]EMA57167.1 hypothetical protein C469_15583 [Halorubrum lipolyticum DSM 21995]